MTVESTMSKALKKSEPVGVPAPASESAALIQMIERLALNPSTNIETIERMLAMRQREKDQQSENDFNEAMALAQAEMSPVAADANNPQTRSKYASYAALDRAIRPIYTKRGIALSFNTPAGATDGYQRVTCAVTNCGHTRQYQIDMPADGKGAKGGDVMTKTHATGSAVSYGMRYLLKMIFNIAVGEADDDGNKASDTAIRERITEAQAAEFKKLLTKADVDEQIIFEHFKVSAITELTTAQLKTATNKCNMKIKLSA